MVSRIMPPRGLQVYVWPPVTLPCDLTHKVDPMDHLCQLPSKLVHLFSKYRVRKFQINVHVENVVPSPTSLA